MPLLRSLNLNILTLKLNNLTNTRLIWISISFTAGERNPRWDNPSRHIFDSVRDACPNYQWSSRSIPRERCRKAAQQTREMQWTSVTTPATFPLPFCTLRLCLPLGIVPLPSCALQLHDNYAYKLVDSESCKAEVGSHSVVCASKFSSATAFSLNSVPAFCIAKNEIAFYWQSNSRFHCSSDESLQKLEILLGEKSYECLYALDHKCLATSMLGTM